MGHLCRRCGNENPTEARFCRNCGAACGDVSVRSLTRLTPLLRQWRKLSHSLTRKDVYKLLGEPAQRAVTPLNDAEPSETWTYEFERAESPSSRIAGRVTFILPDGRVASWSEPDWSQFHAMDPESNRPVDGSHSAGS